mmetsp:Transcript_26622/g.37498  ORF Transcript_26622/g.37498 Transcript_26622/m.37498 type:complete len:379 (+) Transcript_26622:127-1263(+)
MPQVTITSMKHDFKIEEGITALWYYNFYNSFTATCNENELGDSKPSSLLDDTVEENFTQQPNNLRHRQKGQYDQRPKREFGDGNGEDDGEFWMDDEWTVEEMEDAKEMLQSAHDQYGNQAVNKIRKLHYEASKNWNQFYRAHQTNFFNDRHYLPKAFPEEFPFDDGDDSSNVLSMNKKTVVEIGCGVGNAILPLLEQYPNWVVWGFDFSKVGIDLMVQDERFLRAQRDNRAHGYVWDMTSRSKEGPHKDCHGIADICLMLFCLSAVPPKDENMERAACHAAKVLKPGGILVFRDYGRYDQAQFKLGTSRNKSLGNNFYVKHDGTMCYYFGLEDLERLFVGIAGLEIVELRYIRRVYKNRSKDETRRRVWVQARFRKPI